MISNNQKPVNYQQSPKAFLAKQIPYHIKNKTMLRSNNFPVFQLLLVVFLSISLESIGQQQFSTQHLDDLPILLSWDDNGIQITAKTGTNILEMVPSKYLDQMGNNLIRISPESERIPVVIDMTDYYNDASMQHTGDSNSDEEPSKIKIYTPKLVLDQQNQLNSFVIELTNFTKRGEAEQTIILKGLDMLFVGSDKSTNIYSVKNRIIVDLNKSKVQFLQLKGGPLNLYGMEDKIPILCRKYNERYFASSRSNAFICLKDCRNDDPKTPEHQRHARKLITKYNITDFEDSPISFVGEVILTKKGIGLNLKNEMQIKAASGKKGKKGNTSMTDQYIFFPWAEFMNLTFTKYADDHQLMIKDPFNRRYLYKSKVYFSNVELIQFFNELKAMISSTDVMP